MGYKVFQNGFPLPASDLNNFLMNQAVISFASAAERDSNLTAPQEGQLTWLGDSNKYTYYTGTAWDDLIQAATTTVSNKTANYTIVAGDAGNTINSTSTAITVTVANVLTAGQRIDFVQTGAGQITFAAGSGVTLNSKGAKLKTAAQYSAATVLCLASGSYLLVGDLG